MPTSLLTIVFLLGFRHIFSSIATIFSEKYWNETTFTPSIEQRSIHLT